MSVAAIPVGQELQRAVLQAARRRAQFADDNAGGAIGLRIACGQSRPLASITARVAITVSPAPLTS
jgi:hypothetical protein